MSSVVPRLYLIERLRQELLGPRGGPEETLSDETDPREEYTTGVLDCADVSLTDLDRLEFLESEEPSGIECGGDEDEVSDPLLPAAEFAPSVDPRRLPCSIGLTFFVEDSKEGHLELCVSGGRYSLRDKQWKRRSRVWALGALPSDRWNEDFFDKDSGFRVSLRSQMKDRLCRVSVYLLNLGTWDEQSRERASRLLYQPQIRVKLGGGVLLTGLSEWGQGAFDREEARLQLLYRKRAVKARGHMCAAVWREIDPELEAGSPFRWVDRNPDVESFVDCDLRTELLPMLTVPTPEAEWREEFGAPPRLQAMALSDTEQSEMRRALSPLPAAYAAWLSAQEKELSGLSDQYRGLATEHLMLGREALARIERGIELIERDRDVYLAFCFANRAVHLQAGWNSERPLTWRPFQLGFVLLCLGGLVEPDSAERDLCDLLWFPTGGGKTEAYLALTASTLALRRLRHNGYDGVGVISRYTLRLLSIQQFRRALKLVTACEMLRVTTSQGKGGSLLRGWRPLGCDRSKDWLWGKHRFSAGLWLGGAVTPNQLEGNPFLDMPGAFNLLTSGKRSGEADPAQVTECPACGCLMSYEGDEATGTGEPLVLHLRIRGLERVPELDELETVFTRVLSVEVTKISQQVDSLRLVLESKEGALDIDGWWDTRRDLFGADCRHLCARPSRPGYFIDKAPNSKGKMKDRRIELFCPDPSCPTAEHTWQEALPMDVDGTVGRFLAAHEAVAIEHTLSRQCPIPASMVDDQIYAWPPSLLVSTVDKFARIAFEPRVSNLFGNVEYYHAREGFYREGCLRGTTKPKTGHPPLEALRLKVEQLPPPDLVIQDELHLIDGPLGSIVGLYETAVSHLCGKNHRLKYIASTATVREASDQVRALFAREFRQFPPPSLDADDSFFALLRPARLTQETGPGRLYLGYSAPGRGALTPQVRVWAVLLQAAEELRRLGLDSERLDPYWSPVGYYTAIRNLAAAAGLWRQAIPLRMQYLGGEEVRELADPTELSSRVSSSRLPGILNTLTRRCPDAVDGILSTSMFGTGVDVSRLSLMLVQGQPKTTSSYIQATGRVGRQSPGLIVTVLPASNPRSLDHFEFFTGYHLQLYRGVEPVTVYPFAPRAWERALGPLCVALLRQGRGEAKGWRDRETGARLMATDWDTSEVQALLSVFEQRAEEQPELRRPDAKTLSKEVQDALARWRDVAQRESDLLLEEYTLAKIPESAVVLGSPQHESHGLPVVFSNAPQSLRDIESTTGFRI